MLVLAKGNHVAAVQHPLSSRRNRHVVTKLVQKIKSEIAFYFNLAKDTEGASGIEYAIVAAMVAVVTAGFQRGFRHCDHAIFTTDHKLHWAGDPCHYACQLA